MLSTGSIARTAIHIAIPQDAVLVNVGAFRVGGTDDVNPFARLNRILKITPHSFAPAQIEQIEADPIRPGRRFTVAEVIHSEGPFLLATLARAFTFPQPMYVSASFRVRKIQRIGTHPRRDGQASRCAYAEVVVIGDLDKVVDAIER